VVIFHGEMTGIKATGTWEPTVAQDVAVLQTAGVDEE